MIQFKALRYKNILSTGNMFTEINFDEHKTTLVIGENGAGKSTMLDALSFVLFNKPFRKINKPQLLNTITRKELLVEVDFTVSSTSYMIRRGIKPAVFEVFINGEMVNQTAETKDYQETLEKQILKMNFKSFSQVVVLGSATFTSFMQLTTAARREFNEDILNLQVFSTMNSVLKNKVIANQNSIREVESEIKLVNSKIEMTRKHIVETQSNNDKIIAEKQERIADAQKQIDENDAKVIELMSACEALTIDDEEENQASLSKVNDLYRKIMAKAEAVQSEFYFLEKNDDCPTCKQKIDLIFKTETIAAKRKKRDEYNDALKQLTEKKVSLQYRRDEITKIKSKINDMKMDMRILNTKINSSKDYIRELEGDIKNARKISEAPDISQLISLNEKLIDHTKSFNELHEEKNLYALAAVMLKDGGIKAKIIKQYVPVINKLINKYLSAMDFFVDFQFDENFNETIKSRFRDEFSYASFSEGEKFRIDLAIMFTWRAVAKMRNSINTNILIMDEVMDSSLDSNGTDEFLKIIAALTGDTNVFIISHKTDQIVDRFDNVLRFKKVKNFSSLAN